MPSQAPNWCPCRHSSVEPLWPGRGRSLLPLATWGRRPSIEPLPVLSRTPHAPLRSGNGMSEAYSTSPEAESWGDRISKERLENVLLNPKTIPLPTVTCRSCAMTYICIVATLRWLFFAGTNVWYFCPKTQNFVLANISFMYYRTLEFVDPVPLPHTNRKI